MFRLAGLPDRPGALVRNSAIADLCPVPAQTAANAAAVMVPFQTAVTWNPHERVSVPSKQSLSNPLPKAHGEQFYEPAHRCPRRATYTRQYPR